MELQALIEARPSRRHQLGAWYGQLLRVAEQARISTAELAKRLDCSSETIYAWRRRLNANVPTDPGPPREPGLVQVRVADRTPSVTPNRLEVRLRSGHLVFVPAGFEPAALAAVVEALERC